MYVAKVTNTSAAVNFFSIFISKEQTNMASTQGAQKLKQKVLLLYKY